MNKPPRKRRSSWSLRRLLGLGAAIVLVCLVTAGTVFFFFGRDDSDRSNLPEAPEFVASKAAAGEASTTSEGKSPPAEGGAVKPKKAATEDVAPYGLPLNVVLENVPATPEKLTKATPLSAISGLPEGYTDDLVREHEEPEKQKQ